MKKIIFYAKNLKNDKEFRFALDDLYVYEEEVEGVFIRGSEIALNYNSGSGYRGMNPELYIYDVKVINC